MKLKHKSPIVPLVTKDELPMLQPKNSDKNNARRDRLAPKKEMRKTGEVIKIDDYSECNDVEEPSSSDEEDASSSNGSEDDDRNSWVDDLADPEDRSGFVPDYEDSSDEEDLRNTIGNVPVSWYDDMDHVGYDWTGKKVGKGPKRSEIEEFLAKMENPDYWRTVKDRQTGKDVRLSDEQVELVQNTQRHRYPEIGYNPYEPFIEFFTNTPMIHPVSNRPEHKRSFVPSKLEKQKVGRMVHAIKMGWLKPKKPKTPEDDATKFRDLWQTEDTEPLTKSQAARIKMQIPAPKMTLPGHSESYNPPPEYLFTEKEKEDWESQEPEERKTDFVPEQHKSLRLVPAYPGFINNRFNRCLDLYLAPRQRKMRLNVDPKDLLPQLPKPRDLQPYPTTLSLTYNEHVGLVRSVTVEPSVGQYMASGGDDGVVRVWEINSGRCVHRFPVDGQINCVSWCPNPKLTLILAAVGRNIYVVNTQVGDKLSVNGTASLLENLVSSNDGAGTSSDTVEWNEKTGDSKKTRFFVVTVPKDVTWVRWHSKGNYFVSVSKDGVGSEAVFVHQLSKMNSKAPLTKSRGSVQCALFHPSKPTLFVATQKHIRVYDLVKRQLVKKLMPNCRWISSMAVHPKGDNLIVGSYDNRLSWFDLDLSSKPYKSLRNHKGAVRCVDFHPNHPLFASASDDGSVIVCHGRVYNDLMQNPLIVPVKILRGHKMTENLGVLACAFHPNQPWILTAGADSTIKLYTY